MAECDLATVRRFLPRHFADLSGSGSQGALRGLKRQIGGAAIFTDISGFSALTRRFAAGGPGSIETLTEILNTFHTRLIDIVMQHGGDIEDLYGDGMLCLWSAPLDDTAGRADCIRRAVDCAQTLVDTLDGYATKHGVEIRLRAAAVGGPLDLLTVGGHSNEWKYLVGGDPLLEIDDLLASAAPGELAVSPAVREALERRDAVTGPPAAPRESVGAQAAAAGPGGAPDAVATAADDLVGFLPAVVRNRLLTVGDAWLAEFRRVSVVFVCLGDLVGDAEHRIEAFDEAVRLIQVVVRRYDGAFLRASMNDKGPVLFAVFGLPDQGHEDSTERAVLSMIDGLAQIRHLAPASSAGIATGAVYAGAMGSPRRLSYTVVGDAVNLAARVASHGRPGVWIEEETESALSGRIRMRPGQPLERKGGGALPVFEALGRRVPVAKRARMIGRARERATLDTALARLVEERTGSTLLIEGDAGLGKSTLVDSFVGDLPEHVRVRRGQADPIEMSAPFSLWKSLFRGWFDIPSAGMPETILSAAEDLLAANDLDPRFAPLLGPVLPVALPDNETTRQFSGESRAEHTRALLKSLVRAGVAGAPTVLVLEDGHWADSASLSLLLGIMREAERCLIVLTSRPIEGDASQALRRLGEEARIERIRLGPMDVAATREILESELPGTSLPQRLLTVIARRSEGNPFFVRELAIALKGSPTLEKIIADPALAADANAENQLEIPFVLQQLILARVDRLTALQQLTLKVASVLGQEFDRDHISAVFPREAEVDDLDTVLAALAETGIIVPAAGRDEIFGFNHAITHEAVYGLLLEAQRRPLHGALATLFETERAEGRGVSATRIAHHWSEAGRPEKAFPLWREAGGESLETSAYPEAIAVLRRAADVVESGAIEDPHGLVAAEIRRGLGLAYLEVGELEESRSALVGGLEAMRWRWPSGPLGYGTRLGRAFAVRTLQSVIAPRGSAKKNRREAEAIAAHIYESLGQIGGHRNDISMMALATIDGLNLTKRLGDHAKFSRSAGLFALMLRVSRLPAIANRYLTLSLRYQPDAGQPRDRAITLEYAAIYLIACARLAEALELLKEAQALCRTLKDRRRLCDATSLMAIATMFAGNIETSTMLRVEFEIQAEELEDPQLLCWSKLERAELDLFTGKADEATSYLEVARGLLSKTGFSEAAWALGLSARAASALGAHGEAMDFARRTVEAMRAAPFIAFYALEGGAAAADILIDGVRRGDPAADLATCRQAVRQVRGLAAVSPLAMPRAHIIDGRLALLRGNPRGAERAFAKGLRVAEAQAMPFEIALANRHLGDLAVDAEAQERHLGAAKSLFDRLGFAGGASLP